MPLLIARELCIFGFSKSNDVACMESACVFNHSLTTQMSDGARGCSIRAPLTS